MIVYGVVFLGQISTDPLETAGTSPTSGVITTLPLPVEVYLRIVHSPFLIVGGSPTIVTVLGGVIGGGGSNGGGLIKGGSGKGGNVHPPGPGS